MAEWWEALTLVQRVFACIAIPSTLLLVIQTLLLLFGLGHDGADAEVDDNADFGVDTDSDLSEGADADADADTDADTDTDGGHDPGLRIFTVRGIVAFFSVAGWAGLTLLKSSMPAGLSIAIAAGAGILAMVLMALIIKLFLKLQSNGNIDMRNALGLSGSVYISIPPARCGTGKVNIILQNQLGEFDAVTDEETPLKFGEEITVVGLSGSNTLVVKRKNKI